MAVATAIVLSSSPSHSPIAVTPTRAADAAMSSSPGLPSPSAFLSSMPSQLQSGNRVAPIPKDAILGFKSASTLLRQVRSSDEKKACPSIERLGLAERFGSAGNGNIPVKPTLGKREKSAKEEVPIFKKPVPVGGREFSVEKPLDIQGQEGSIVLEAGNALQPPSEEGGHAQKPVKLAKQKDPITQVNAGKAVSAKKSRQKKTKEPKQDDGQTKIKKAKITKPGNSKPVDKAKKVTSTAKKTKPTTNETFNTLLPSQEENAKAREEFRDLCLAKAIPIRRGWTPCKDTTQRLPASEAASLTPIALEPPRVDAELCSDTMQDNTPQVDAAKTSTTSLATTSVTNASQGVIFGQLLGDFGYADASDEPIPRPGAACASEGQKVIKKRKLEFVNGINAPMPAEKPQKNKSPKKKARTITEKATAPFIPVDAAATPSLLQYFGTPPAATESLPHAEVTDAPVTVRRKIPAKKNTKPKFSVPKTKKQAQPILLSPESAMRNIGAQEMVFGTSSQLAREESPTMIKDLQQAMEESATLSQEWGSSNLPAGRFQSSHALVLARSKNLWSVASRNAEGSLLEIDSVDLTETPKPPKSQAQSVICPVVPREVVSPATIHKDNDNQKTPKAKREISTLSITSVPTLEPTPEVNQAMEEPNLVIPRSVAEATLKKRPNNRSPVKNATHLKSDPKQMPNYQGFTDEQLSKEVKAYGFKPIKTRKAMIKLLEQCWESKVTMTLQEVQANLQPTAPTTDSANVETPKEVSPPKKKGRPRKTSTEEGPNAPFVNSTPPKKPRGRPKKDLTATTPHTKQKRKAKEPVNTMPAGSNPPLADEIYDSSPSTPSPPRRPSSKSPGKLPLRQTKNGTNKTATADNGKDCARIFEHITQAVKTFPPTHDPNSLTFHEKMLMYEPIVLEDLTAWLNSIGLGRVGEDDEVEPLLVKQWCEERSICCLWKENLRGGERGRW